MNKPGKILAKLRKEHNLGQKEIAVLLHVSVGTVSNYENDVHSPALESLCALADFYGVTTDYLLGRTNYRFDLSILTKPVSKECRILDVVHFLISCKKK